MLIHVMHFHITPLHYTIANEAFLALAIKEHTSFQLAIEPHRVFELQGLKVLQHFLLVKAMALADGIASI